MPVCRVHVCTCAIILVLVCGIMYRIRTYRYQLVISRLPRYVYVDTYVPGWGTYYVPHTYVNWCEHVCTWYQPAPKIRICRYVCTRATSPPQKKEQKAQHRLRERHTHNATVIAQQGACNNYGQRYRGCTCCLMDTESLMIRRPFGSIDPNSIRETELHTECRRRRERESLNSPRRDRERDAARQRAAATRMREIDEERAERCVFHCLRCQQPYTLGAAAK